MPSAVREAITGVWGEAPEGLWQCPWSWSQGGFTPEAENFEAFLRLKEDPKLCCQYVKTV